MLPINGCDTVQRCHVPSGAIGPSQSCTWNLQSWHPALAGGAAAIDAPAANTAASSTKQEILLLATLTSPNTLALIGSTPSGANSCTCAVTAADVTARSDGSARSE